MTMPRVIHKHEILNMRSTKIDLVQYAKIVKVEVCDRQVCFWEEHLIGLLEKYTDEVAPLIWESWEFRIFGTGDEIDDTAGKYIGTGIDGPFFVWHLYGKRI